MAGLATEILLLTAHLLCVNVAGGAPLVGAWFEWRGPGDPAARRAADYLSLTAWVLLIAGGLLGLLLGSLRWTDEAQTLWTGALRSRLVSSLGELAFSLVLLVIVWAWRRRSDCRRAAGRWTRGVLAVLAATNLLYHFPLLFLVAAQLADPAVRAELGVTLHEPLPRAVLHQLLLRGETPALTVHVAAASLAAAGVLLLGLALRLRRAGDEAGAARVAAWGGGWALAPTLAQLPIGLWTLATLPTPLQAALTGNNLSAAGCFGLSLLAAFWLTQELAQVAFGDHARPRLVRAMSAFLVTVLLMTAAHQLGRLAVQGPAAAPAPSAAASSAAWLLPKVAAR